METTRHHAAPRTTTVSLLDHLIGPTAWAAAGRGLLLLPAALRRPAPGGRASPGAGTGAGTSEARGARTVRTICGIPLGLFGWVVALFAGQATANGLLYPLLDAHDYQHSWGGPTLVGAWVVHAAVAIPVVLATLGILRGLVAVDRVNERAATPGAPRPWWRIPLSAALMVMAVLLINAWAHQV